MAVKQGLMWFAAVVFVCGGSYISLDAMIRRDAFRDARLAAEHWRAQDRKAKGTPVDGYSPTTYYSACLGLVSDAAFYLTDGVEPDMSVLEDRWFPHCSPLWRDVRCEDEGREEVCMLHNGRAPF